MIEEFTDEEARFRLDACLRKMLGKELTPEEQEVIRDVRRRNGWDGPSK